MKRFLLLGLILVAGLIGLSSCTEVVRPLEGTWTVVSTDDPTAARALGNGTITLSFLAEPIPGWEAYTGSGTFVGGTYDYIVEGLYLEGFGITIEMYEALGDDPDFDYIILEDSSYSGGGMLSGNYTGTGLYGDSETKDIGDGTFTATK